MKKVNFEQYLLEKLKCWGVLFRGDVPTTPTSPPINPLNPTGVTAGTYGSAYQVGSFTVDANGRLTNATNVTITFPINSLSDVDTTTNAPSSGQVLKWNGTQWVPSNDVMGSGGVADNWGTQVAQVNSTLSGDGTSSNPLKIAQQGATTGQGLVWNGTSWLPQDLPSLLYKSVNYINQNTTYTTDPLKEKIVITSNSNISLNLDFAPISSTYGQRVIEVVNLSNTSHTVNSTQGIINFLGVIPASPNSISIPSGSVLTFAFNNNKWEVHGRAAT